MFRVLFYFGKRQQIFNDCRKTVDLSGDDAEEPLGINAVFHGPGKKRFNKSLDRRKRRAKLVGNIGHKIFSHVLELFELRDIIKDQERTYSFFLAVAKRASMELKNTLGVRGLSRQGLYKDRFGFDKSRCGKSFYKKILDFTVAEHFAYHFTDRTPLIDAEKHARGPVDDHDPFFRVNGNDPFDHAR